MIPKTIGQEKVATGQYVNGQGLEKGGASEAFTSAQNLTGCHNSGIMKNNTLMQYFKKNKMNAKNENLMINKIPKFQQ